MSQAVQAPLTLDQVSKLFSNWRETRAGKGPIPESLLRAIARLDLRFQGQSPIEAQVYIVERVRCRTCSQEFEANLPHGLSREGLTFAEWPQIFPGAACVSAI